MRAMRQPFRFSRTTHHAPRTTGFTIVELMVAIALMLMLMGVAVFIFSFAVKIFTRSSAETQIYQTGQIAMEILRNEIQACRPLLTPEGFPNNQQMVVAFDAVATVGQDPWRFDRLSFRTMTADPAIPSQNVERWVVYWVQGGSKTPPGTPGTLMRYISPGQIPPATSSGEIANVAGIPAMQGEPKPSSDWGGADWIKEGGELCQNVSFFGVEVFYDPDQNSDTTGLFFDNGANNATGIKGYDSPANGPGLDYDSALYDPFVPIVGSLSGLFLNSTQYKDPADNPTYNVYTTGADVDNPKIKLPSQLRITLRVQDDKNPPSQRRTIQEQIWIPMAD